MALIPRPLIVDGVNWGTVFTFEKAGDIFPTHMHATEAENHISILASGGIRCHGHPNHEGVELYAMAGGTIVNWKAGEPHGFVALTDGATLVNLVKVRK